VVLLRQFPPQTASRDSASQWGCYIHNLVNRSLGKASYDCGKVTEKYQCGCAADEGGEGKGEGDARRTPTTTKEVATMGKGGEVDRLEENTSKAQKGARVEIERVGMQNGG